MEAKSVEVNHMTSENANNWLTSCEIPMWFLKKTNKYFTDSREVFIGLGFANQ